MKKLLFTLSMVAFVCSCIDKPTTTDDQQEELTWGKASLCIENPIAPGDSLCYHIELNIDTLAGEGKLAKSLSQVIRDSVIVDSQWPTVYSQWSIRQVMQAFADSTEAEWQAEMTEMYDPESEFRETLQYYYTIDGTPVETDNDSIMSYQTTTDCYLGGAHGSYVIFYYNFDKQTGKLLSIKDVVPQEKEQEVLKAMEKQLCEDWEAKDLADLQEKTGITMLGDLYLTNNFLLKKDSIEFLFNQYDIAPYAAGLIGVTVGRP